MPRGRGTKLSDEEIEQINALAQEGLSQVQIAEKLGRSRKAVQNALNLRSLYNSKNRKRGRKKVPMEVNWHKCFLCLTNLGSSSSSSCSGGKKQIKIKPTVLMKYLLMGSSPNQDENDRLFETLVSSNPNSVSSLIKFCDKCVDTAKEISDLQLKLEVIQMKIINILASVRKTVISNSKVNEHTDHDGVSKLGLEVDEFGKWLETQESSGRRFPLERQILDTFHAFQAAVFENSKESVQIPLVYIQKYTGYNRKIPFPVDAPGPEDEIIKTEPAESDHLEETENDLEFDDDYSKSTSIEFNDSEGDEHWGMDINDVDMTPLDHGASKIDPSPSILQKPSKKSNKTAKRKKGKKSSAQRRKPRKVKVKSDTTEETWVPRLAEDTPVPPPIKEEISELEFEEDEEDPQDGVSSTELPLQLEPEQDVKTEESDILTRRSRSAATAAIQRMSEIQLNNKKVEYQFIPKKGRKRKIAKNVDAKEAVFFSHPNKVFINPLNGEEVDSKKGKKLHVKFLQKKRKHIPNAKKKIKTVRRCDLCPGYHSNRTFNYEQHLRTHETDTINHICQQCHRKFTGKQYYEYHLSFHDDSNRMRCDVCHVRVDPTLLYDHCRTHVDKVIQCRCCSFCCTSLEKFIVHTRYHGSNSLHCYLCDQTLPTRRRFYMHLHHEHQAVEILKCDVGNCNKDFFDPALLNLHKKKHIRAFKCPECQKIFSTVSSLDLHMTLHTGKREFQCDECPESLITRSALETHKISKHGAPKLKCEFCPKEYINGSSLRAHEEMMHGRGYRCDQCDKVYGSMCSLRKHKLTHLETKSIICEECGKGFANKDQFRNHSKLHVGEKAHKCSYCPKAFALRRYLTVHLRIHTGERPFICEICGKDFNQRAALWMHKKSQHKNELQTNAANESHEDNGVVPANDNPDSNYNVSNL